MPGSVVHTFDVNPTALEICDAAARVNRAEQNIRLRGAASPATIAGLLRGSSSAFLLVDCEGCEVSLLDALSLADLSRCSVLVECHDLFIPGTSDAIEEKLAQTHRVERIRQGGLNPHAFLQLQTVPENLRWLAMSEKRAETMCWISAVPRGA